MKRTIILITGLIAIDQGIKLLVSCLFIGQSIVLVPGVLLLKPIINTHLNWIASMAGFQTPVALMIFLQLLFLALALLVRRYCIYLMNSVRNLVDVSFSFLVAGLGCSFIDVVFWGGSLDFLRLFDWFTFDSKDVFLDLSIIFLALFCIKYEKSVHSFSKAERRNHGFWRWLKNGCPPHRSKSSR